MFTLDQIKIDLIKSHPTFICPVNKSILDYRTSEIVVYKVGETMKTDIISKAGLETLKQNGLYDKLSMAVIQSSEEL